MHYGAGPEYTRRTKAHMPLLHICCHGRGKYTDGVLGFFFFFVI